MRGGPNVADASKNLGGGHVRRLVVVISAVFCSLYVRLLVVFCGALCHDSRPAVRVFRRFHFNKVVESKMKYIKGYTGVIRMSPR